MKKIISVLLALIMTLALSVTALAANEGSITVDNAVNGKTYTIYRIFDLNDHNSDYSAINYKVSTKWADFFKTGAKGLEYVTIDGQGYVTWKENASAADFAAKAIEFAKANSIVNDGDAVAANGKVEFKNLTLGYYLVQSDLGALCSLDTTMPNVTIEEKNAEPTNVKTVQEDSDKAWGETNDADIGQTVNFKSTITAQAGAENYVFHDKMSTGLTYGSVTGVTLNGKSVEAKGNYTVKTSELTDDCTFEVIFTKDFCDTLKAGDKIVISYTATVNENAVVGTDGNLNTSKVSYGENGKFSTTPSTTKTYTWQMEVLKYTMKDNKETPLAGAQFVLYKTVNNVKYYAVVDANNKITGWTTEGVKPEENADESKTYASVFTTPASGKFTITGLDSDTYYLEEIVAPAGYNLLKEAVKVTIGNNGTVSYGTSTGEVRIENQSGTELPSTGGMGTTIFYVLGGVLMAGAFVLLVVRKRMRTE